MTNQQLYEAIFHRKSIRKYDMTHLDSQTLVNLENFAGSIIPLDDKIRYELSYLITTDVKNILPIKAPHYICLYSEKKDNYLMNTGFILQQIDLYLSSNNIASCWLGMAKPNKQVPKIKDGLEFVIMLAFGNTSEPIHRTELSAFRRKSLSEVSLITDGEEIIEPVRLAPSASNTQPWFLSGSKTNITISREKLNIIKAPLYGKMNQIDIGIALCHLWLTLKHLGKTPIYDFEKSDSPDGYEFMANIKVEECN